jgi:thiol-disulfide isomerase/thioredoxin
VCAVLFAGLLGCAAAPAGPVEVSEVRFESIDQALKDRKGKVILVDFWATWCVPCVKKFPHLVELHRKYGDKGLACVSVSMDRLKKSGYSKDNVFAFLKDKGADFPNFILSDPDTDDKKMTDRFGSVEAIPYMVMFDRAGKRVWTSDEYPEKTSDKERDELLVKKIEAELAKPAP